MSTFEIPFKSIGCPTQVFRWPFQLSYFIYFFFFVIHEVHKNQCVWYRSQICITKICNRFLIYQGISLKDYIESSTFSYKILPPPPFCYITFFKKANIVVINDTSLPVHPSPPPNLYPFFSRNCLHILSNVFRSTEKQPTPEVGSIRCGSTRIQRSY